MDNIRSETDSEMNNSERKSISYEDYEIGVLRKQMEDFEDRIIEKYTEMKKELYSLRQSINRTGGRIGNFTVKELIQLKQIGINPKDLISNDNSILDGKEEEKTNNRDVSRV